MFTRLATVAFVVTLASLRGQQQRAPNNEPACFHTVLLRPPPRRHHLDDHGVALAKSIPMKRGLRLHGCWPSSEIDASA